MKKIRILQLMLAVGIFSFTGATAQYTQSAKVVSANRESRAEFGTSVAVNGDYAVVGASRENFASGNAYVYHKDSNGNWAYAQSFSAPDPNEGAEFGGGAKITANQLVIAAGRADVDGEIRAGALYVYSLNGTNWDYDTKLVASDYSYEAKMGMNPTSLAVADNIIVAGAPGENGWVGSVYIFEKIGGTWTQTQKLMNPNPSANENFGIGVALSGNYLIVGSDEEDGTKGAVHIFTKDGSGTWVHQQKIVASDASSTAYFGGSVSMSNGTIAVGAYGENGETGATYLFEDDGTGNWVQAQKLTASSPSDEAQYGWNCKIQNDRLVVSAPHIYGLEKSEVYVYSKDGGNWNEIQKVESLDLATEDFYGWNIEMDGDALIVGATWDDEDANGENPIDRAGSAYVFNDPTILSNNDHVSQNNLTIYPVPATNQITISSNSNIASIIVTNQLGAMVEKQSNINTKDYNLDVSNFGSGVYFLRINGNDGFTTFKKVIVSK